MNIRVGECFVARIAKGYWGVYQITSVTCNGDKVSAMLIKVSSKKSCENYVRHQQ